VASPICPTTAVSTAPKIGIVALDKTTGNAKNKTRLWVISEDIILFIKGFLSFLMCKKEYNLTTI
jgi:hypothetical protein